MNGKTRKVYWQVLATFEGKQWPLMIETFLPATPTKFKEASENVANWLLSCNMYPWLGKIPLVETPPANGQPMPERDAVQPENLAPSCPTCKTTMIRSRHQKKEGATVYYCPQRKGSGDYCSWRGETVPGDPAPRVWEISS